MTIGFRVRGKSSREHSIKVYISLGRNKYFEARTGFTIHRDNWVYPDDKRNSIMNWCTGNTSKIKTVKSNLKKLDAYLYERINEDLGRKQVIINFNWLKKEIDKCFDRIKETNNNIVTAYYQEIIDSSHIRKVKGKKKLGISNSRKNSLIGSRKILSEFENETKAVTTFLDIDKSFYIKFTKWLLDTKEYSLNHSGKQISNLKMICKEAEEDDIQVNSYYKRLTPFSKGDEDRYIQTLSFDELNKIRRTNFENQKLHNAKKWILIGCEIGQRGGDLLNVTFDDNIRYKGGNMYIDLSQEKSIKKKDVTIRILDEHIIKIIENEFPYKIAQQNLNDYIKDVCRLSGITKIVKGEKFNKEKKRNMLGMYPKHELITTHSFRRSFASNYYKNIPTPILMSITGHEKESTFLLYINRVEDKDANADLYAVFYEKMQKENELFVKQIVHL